MGWATDSSNEAAFLRCLLKVFPDRLAKRRDKGTLICELAGGRRAELAKDSTVRDEELIIAAELEDAIFTYGELMRQAGITNEILDIVNGAEALNS